MGPFEGVFRDGHLQIQPRGVSGTWEMAVSPATVSHGVDVRVLESGGGQCRVCTTQYAKIATLFSLRKHIKGKIWDFYL